MRLLSLLALAMSLATLGCQSPPKTTDMLNSPAGTERMRAVTRLADENRWSNIPTFIRFLEDNDVSVRWAAFQALNAQAGQDFGFRPDDPPQPRADAVQRWKEWWKTEGSRGSERGAARSPNS